LQSCARENFAIATSIAHAFQTNILAQIARAKLMLLDQDLNSLCSAFLLLGRPACGADPAIIKKLQ